MPIIIKDFTWNQTEDKIVIQVPVHGVHPSKADVFTSSQYIKMSLGSFFFEVVLLHPIDVTEIICTKSPTEILFDLKKCYEEIWDSLEITSLTKQERIEFKMKLIQEEHERIQKEREARIAKKAELKRVAVNEQIQLDTKVRNRIEEIKKMEETQALGDLNKWKKAIEAPKTVRSKILSLIDDKTDHLHNTNGGVKIIELEDEDIKKEESPSPIDNKVTRKIRIKSATKQKNDKTKSVPKPRSTRSLQILFTPREFPTPCRESRLEEENEFLRKQAEARRSAGFINEDLRPEEKNPQFLIAKGKEFLKNNNYLGAISAFSFGIKLNPKFLDLYVVRSEAHLAVGNFKRAIDDCSSALELLKPALPINLDDRALCIGRRGIALYKLGFMKEGISELKSTLKLKKSEDFEKLLVECQLEYEELKEMQQKEKEKEKQKREKQEEENVKQEKEKQKEKNEKQKQEKQKEKNEYQEQDKEKESNEKQDQEKQKEKNETQKHKDEEKEKIG